MLNNKKIFPFKNSVYTTYIFAFLVFCVFSSKHIIIYNEEILVALSFFFFVLFVYYYFGNNIQQSLDERSTAIQAELQNFLILKKKILNELFKEYKKAFKSQEILQNLTNFTKSQLKNKSQGSEKALKTIFSHLTNYKLKNCCNTNLNIKNKLQQIISDQLLTNVLIKMKKLKKKKFKQKKYKINFNFLT